MSLPTPCFPCGAPMRRLVSAPMPVASVNLSHMAGNSRLTPNNKTIPPDTTAHTAAGIPSSAVVALSKSVKTSIETTRLAIVTSGCLSDTLFCHPAATNSRQQSLEAKAGYKGQVPSVPRQQTTLHTVQSSQELALDRAKAGLFIRHIAGNLITLIVDLHKCRLQGNPVLLA